jgi:hypothetical protein
MILIREVHGKDLSNQARELFIEYQKSLDIDLSFQNFDRELKWLPLPYLLASLCSPRISKKKNWFGVIKINYKESKRT